MLHRPSPARPKHFARLLPSRSFFPCIYGPLLAGEACAWDGGDCCYCTCVSTPFAVCGRYGFDCLEPAGDATTSCDDQTNYSDFPSSAGDYYSEIVEGILAEFPDCTALTLAHVGDGRCDTEVNVEGELSQNQKPQVDTYGTISCQVSYRFVWFITASREGSTCHRWKTIGVLYAAFSLAAYVAVCRAVCSEFYRV